MTNAHYQPPRAHVETTVQGSSTKAVLLGLTVDLGGSLFFGLVYTIAWGFYLASRGMTMEDIEQEITNAGFFSLFNLIGSAVGMVFSFLGGYVCAKKSVQHVVRDTGIMCAITVVFGLLISSNLEWWQHLVYAVAAVVVTYAGAFTAARCHKSR